MTAAWEEEEEEEEEEEKSLSDLLPTNRDDDIRGWALFLLFSSSSLVLRSLGIEISKQGAGCT